MLNDVYQGYTPTIYGENSEAHFQSRYKLPWRNYIESTPELAKILATKLISVKNVKYGLEDYTAIFAKQCDGKELCSVELDQVVEKYSDQSWSVQWDCDGSVRDFSFTFNSKVPNKRLNLLCD